MRSNRLRSAATAVAVIAALVMGWAPILWLFSVAFRPGEEFFQGPLDLLPTRLDTSSIREASMEQGRLLATVVNSLLLSGGVAAIATTCGLSASLYFVFYSTGRRFAKHIGIGLIASRFLPPAAMVGGLYWLLGVVKGIDRVWGLILVNSIPALALAVLIFTPLVSTIARSNVEQGRIEGLTSAGLVLRVVLPDIWRFVLFVGVLCFSLAWNEFFFGSIISETLRSQPLSVRVATSIGQYRINYNVLALGGLISMFPLLPAVAALALLGARKRT